MAWGALRVRASIEAGLDVKGGAVELGVEDAHPAHREPALDLASEALPGRAHPGHGGGGRDARGSGGDLDRERREAIQEGAEPGLIVAGRAGSDSDVIVIAAD